MITGVEVWASLIRSSTIGQSVDLQILREGQPLTMIAVIEGTVRDKTLRSREQ